MRTQAGRKAGRQSSQSFISVVSATRFAVCIGRCCAGPRTNNVTSQMQKPNPIYKSHALLAIGMADPGGNSTDKTPTARPWPPSIDAGALLCSALPPAHTHTTPQMTGRWPLGGRGLGAGPPSFTSSAATLGEISNKLNRQSSDLAYDLTAGVLLFMIMTLLRGIYGSSSPPPIKVPLTVRGNCFFGYLEIQTQDMLLLLRRRFLVLLLMCRRPI